MLIFLYGADDFRSRRFLNGLKEKFIRDVDPGASSLESVDGSSTTLKDLSAKINTGSLFVTKRLIVVDDIFRNKKTKIFDELAGYLKDYVKSQDNVLIFRDGDIDSKDRPVKADEKKLFKLLREQPYSQEFKLLAGAQLATFIKKEVASYEKDISAPAANLLAGLTGGDLWLIAGNLKKLAYGTNGKEISLEAVKASVAGSYDENIFGLTDALSGRNKKEAARLLEEQYAAGASDEYLIAMLIRQFKILLQIREELDRGANPADFATRLKIHPFVAKKGSSQARNFDASTLKAYLDRLIRLDYQNKTGQGDIKTELVLLIAGL